MFVEIQKFVKQKLFGVKVSNICSCDGLYPKSNFLLSFSDVDITFFK